MEPTYQNKRLSATTGPSKMYQFMLERLQDSLGPNVISFSGGFYIVPNPCSTRLRDFCWVAMPGTISIEMEIGTGQQVILKVDDLESSKILFPETGHPDTPPSKKKKSPEKMNHKTIH